MESWISGLDQQMIFLALNGVMVLLLTIVVYTLKKLNRHNVSEKIDLAVEQILRAQNEAQNAHDEKQLNAQQRLFDTLMQDREKQLASLTQLRLELEKRFADSSVALTNNIQEFKHQMVERFEQLKSTSARSIAEGQQQVATSVNQFGEKINLSMEQHQNQTRETIAAHIRQGIETLRKDLDRSIKQQNETLTQSISRLTDRTDNRLKEISGQVEQRLSEGFEKTTQTFNDILKRLALIDDAQKKITELSGNVVSLQEVLNDKRSRGAFGEVQLKALIANTMPESHYQMQQKLSNDKIADCMLYLPDPTGQIAIDAKFPLESYRKMTDISLADADRKEASKQFMRDIKKHINDIANKYIIPPETADGAVMFIPAESVFAEIHGHYPELVEFAYTCKVWMVSPTTLMAILTTASAVIMDEQTRKQVHIIKEHLSALGRDFVRFQSRMENLSRHIGLVSKDVEQVHVSARKISSRFEKIDRVELSHDEQEKASRSLEKPTENLSEEVN